VDNAQGFACQLTNSYSENSPNAINSNPVSTATAFQNQFSILDIIKIPNVLVKIINV
jgi:hypothetical protein